MRTFITNFLREEDGITALEYGLLAAVVAGLLVGVAKTQLGLFFTDLFTALTASVTEAIGEADTGIG